MKLSVPDLLQGMLWRYCHRVSLAVAGHVGHFTCARPFKSIRGGGISMEDLAAQVANVGFPIAVSIYLLVRVEAKIENLTNSINELTKVIAAMRV